MILRKVVLSMFAVVAMAQVQPYKIFVESYSNPGIDGIEETYKNLVNELKDYKDIDDIRISKQYSGKYYCIEVETVTDQSSVDKLLARIRSIPAHEDAFYIPKSKLSNIKSSAEGNAIEAKENTLKDEKNANEDENVVVSSDEVSDSATHEDKNDIKEVDTQTAMASRSDDQGKLLTLPNAINILLERNPSVAKSIYEYMEIGKDLDISQRAFYPTLDLRGSIGVGRERIENTDEEWHKNVPKEAELRLVQKLFDGGLSSSIESQEMARTKNAAYLILQNADRNSLAATAAYLDVIKEKALLDLSLENIATLEEIYDKIKERADNGYGRTSEKQQAASRLTLAQSNFIAQQNAYDDSLTTFKRLIGISVDASQLAYPQFVHELPENINKIEEKAMHCNPAVRAEMANIDLAKAILKSSDSDFLPRLNIEAFARVEDVEDFANRNGQRIDSYGALLRLDYNLFNKGIDKLTEEKRKITIQKEEEILKSIKDELRESLNFSWQSYVLNSKKIGYVSDHAKFSKATLDSYKEEFKIGRRDLISVLDAENEFFNARKELVTVERDILYAKYRLLDNMGLITDSFKPGFGQSYVKDACSLENR